jgi:glyoxalase/bleomycin resistance protein/dioxygenase superfamily protein
MTGNELDALTCRTICQIGIVVEDIEHSARVWADALGVDVPDWRLTAAADETNIRYRSGPTEARAKLAFIEMENITIELIEPVDGPSTWQEFLDAKGEGVHHIAFRIKDTDAHVSMLAGKGLPMVQQGEFKNGRYSYIDSGSQLGVLLELLENTSENR